MGQSAQASLFPAKQPSAQEPWKLLSGWEWMPIEALGTIVGGGTPSKSRPEYWNGTIPWVSPKDMKSLEISETQDHVSEIGIEQSATKLLPPGTVLIVFRSGILAHTLPVAIASRALTVNQDLKAIVPHDRFDPRYIAYALTARAQSILSHCVKKGATVHSLEGSRFWSERVPVPFLKDTSRSLDIQRRIVARIEALLAEVKEARALAAAIRHDTDRIMEAALKEVFPTSEELLPPGWRLSTIEEIKHTDRDPVQTGPFGAQLKSEEFVEAGVPVVAIGNVQWGELDTRRLHYVTEAKAKQLARYKLEPGDILFTRMGTVGRSCVVPQFADGWLMTYHLIRIAVDPRNALSRFIFYCFRGSPTVAEQILQKGKGATREGVNSEILRNLRLLLPPLRVQQEIVTHLDTIQAEVDEMRRLQAQDVELLDQLEQSILERAFRGEL